MIKNNDEQKLEIKEYKGDELVPQTTFQNWKVAISRYKPQSDEKNINSLERHNETDEVFILITGSATLLIGKDMKRYTMEQGKIYNVHRNTWHRMCMTEGTQVVVVENADTTKDNSEYISINREEKIC